MLRIWKGSFPLSLTWDLFPKLSATYGDKISPSGDAEQEYLEYFTEQGWELWHFPSILGAAALKTAGFLSSLIERSVGKAAQGNDGIPVPGSVQQKHGCGARDVGWWWTWKCWDHDWTPGSRRIFPTLRIPRVDLDRVLSFLFQIREDFVGAALGASREKLLGIRTAPFRTV